MASGSCTPLESPSVLPPQPSVYHIHIFERNPIRTYLPKTSRKFKTNLSAPLDIDISMVDMDWINMFGIGLDEDWAWLADVNATGMAYLR